MRSFYGTFGLAALKEIVWRFWEINLLVFLLRCHHVYIIKIKGSEFPKMLKDFFTMKLFVLLTEDSCWILQLHVTANSSVEPIKKWSQAG